MLFLFDLDGTLVDTSPGIIHCYNYAAALFQREQRPADQFRGIIGGPLLGNFQRYYHMDEDTARRAVEVYRKEYGATGIYEAAPYEGITELLAQIRKAGHKTGIATLKREDFAWKMMRHFHMEGYFDAIFGIDERDSLTKAALLEKCMQATGSAREETWLIGDSIHDARGAEEAGVRFIGVAYGWGFDTVEDIQAGYHSDAAASVEELQTIVEKIISKEERE